MDEIFRSNPGPFVFRNKDLTQRKRPQRFMEAERARIEQVDKTEIDEKTRRPKIIGEKVDV